MSSRRIGRRGQRPRPRLATRRPAVEAMERRELLSVVTSNADSGAGTLRQAIVDANANKGLDQITFNLPAGQTTIVVKSSLPVISDPVVIDGLTQPGSNGVPIVEVTGRVGTANGAGDGLQINAGGSTVRGLVINGFSGNGIYLLSGDNNTVQNNYIGTGVSSTDDVGNSRHGILIQGSSNNVIGGDRDHRQHHRLQRRPGHGLRRRRRGRLQPDGDQQQDPRQLDRLQRRPRHRPRQRRRHGQRPGPRQRRRPESRPELPGDQLGADDRGHQRGPADEDLGRADEQAEHDLRRRALREHQHRRQRLRPGRASRSACSGSRPTPPARPRSR